MKIRFWHIWMIVMAISFLSEGMPIRPEDKPFFVYEPPVDWDQKSQEVLRVIFKKGGGLLVLPSGDRKFYQVASRVRKDDGLAWFSLTDRFELKADESFDCPSIPNLTTTYMCRSSLLPMKHGDSRFVHTEGVTLGVFKTLLEWLENIQESGDEKTRFLASVKKICDNDRHYEEFSSCFREEGFFVFDSIRFERSYEDPPEYRVVIRREGGGTWCFSVDIIDGNVKCSKFAQMM